MTSLNKNVIVTGGAGYIGSHACKALREAGYTPITIDNLSTGWSDAVKFGPLEIVDLLDKFKLDLMFELITADMALFQSEWYRHRACWYICSRSLPLLNCP